MNLLDLLPANRPIRNTSLKEAPILVYDQLIFTGTTEVTVPVIDQNLSLILIKEAGLTVSVINNEKDLNEILEITWLSREELKEILKDYTLMSYSLFGKIRSKGNLQISDILGFEIGANRLVELSQITTHNKEKTLEDALLNDLIDFKNILTHSGDISFWDTLKSNEALTFSLIGDLDFEISVNILKLLSVAFAPVFSLTSYGPKFPLEIDSSLGVRFKATKNDSFYLLIAKRQDGTFKLSIKKNRQKNQHLSISGSLSISLINEDAQILSGIIDNYFEKYLGKPLAEIERILEQAEEIREDNYLIILAEKIAFDGYGVMQLTERFDTYKKEITDARQKVLDIVSDTIKAGIEYQYRKEQSDGILLEAQLSKEVLIGEIRNLVKLNISNLIAKARRNESGIEVNKYLDEKSLKVEEYFSFGISLGNWALKSASGQTYQYDEKNIGLPADRAVKLAFLDEKVITNFGEEATIQVSLDAETPKPDKTLTYNDLEYALTLISKKTDQRIHRWDKKDLHGFLQTALTWNIFQEKELNDFFESIWNNLLKNRNVEYECKLHIPKTIFPETIKALSINATVEAIAEAMAGSILPNNADDRSLLISGRKEFYTPLIADAFQGKDIMKTFDQPLYTGKYKKWRNFEIAQIRNQNHSGTDSFMGIANNRTFRNFQKLVAGIKLMNDHLQNHKKLEEDLENSILKFFFDAFHAIVKDQSGFAQRWLGYF